MLWDNIAIKIHSLQRAVLDLYPIPALELSLTHCKSEFLWSFTGKLAFHQWNILTLKYGKLNIGCQIYFAACSSAFISLYLNGSTLTLYN